MKKKTKLGSLWLGFKVLTVLISFFLSLILLISGGYALFHDNLIFGLFLIFISVGCWSFSKILEQDLRNEEKSDDGNTTTVYKLWR